jgi:hypothetical protein
MITRVRRAGHSDEEDRPEGTTDDRVDASRPQQREQQHGETDHDLHDRTGEPIVGQSRDR